MTDIYEFKPGQKKREEEKREEKTGFDREALIAKILALLAKTVERGCTGPEAKEAAKKARAMMEDYGITIEELKAAEEKAEHTKAGAGPDFDWDAFHRMFMSGADLLIEIGSSAHLFHAPDGDCYADVMVDGHRATWPLGSRDFRLWLTAGYFEERASAPGSDAMRRALDTLEAKALLKGPEHPVFVRVGGHEGKIYLDLCDDKWRALEVDGDGWRVVEPPPIRFRRKEGMRPLPMPNMGTIDLLRPFVNITSDADFVLIVAWLLAALHDRGPYPVLVLGGGQGAAKSTLAKMLRALVDPSTVPLRNLPRDDHELCISARNSFVLAFDNVSGIPGGTSDMLCRLACGGGNTVRRLYTDGDEVLFDAQRPILMNGIGDVVSRPDLADRSIFITLDVIDKKKRMTEKALAKKFEAMQPRILGALLDAVSYGLKHPVELEEKPRMADFAERVASCEPALWKRGAFMAAYYGNIDGAVESMIEASPIAAAVRTLMDSRITWEGTMESLLEALSNQVGEKVSRRKDWPQSARGMANAMARAESNLREIGIVLVHGHRTGQARPVQLVRSTEQPSSSSRTSQTAENREKYGDDRCDDGNDDRSSVTSSVIGSVTKKPLETADNDDHDGHDGRIAHPAYGHDEFSVLRLKAQGGQVKERKVRT